MIALQLELAEKMMGRDPDAAVEQVRAARVSVDEARRGTRDLAARFRGVPLPDELANAADLLRAAGLTVDLLVDTMGGPGLAGLLRSVAPGGRAVLVGYVSGTRLELDLSRDLIQRDVSLLPVNMLRRQRAAREAAEALLPRLARGELTLPVTRYPLAEAPAALAALARGRVTGRLALTVD